MTNRRSVGFLVSAALGAMPVAGALGAGSVAPAYSTAASAKPTGCQLHGPGLADAATPAGSYTARLIAPSTAVRRLPSLSAKPFRTIRAIAPLNGGDVNLLVTGRACDDHERVWLRVLIPQRPNGNQGWVRRDPFELRRNAFRIVIDQSDFFLTVFENNHRVLRARVAVGKPETPTPFGHFAIAEKIYTNSPGGFLGPLVMPTTGFSETLNEYAGGNGRFAIHGTSKPEFIGTRASHGCIRMLNFDVIRLGKIVRPGTPILIQP